MSWLKDLYQTYQNNQPQVGLYRDCKNPLLPVGHMLMSTQIEITLEQNGQLVNAEADDLRDTISPCTEKSATRVKGYSRPLNECLEYLDRDFYKYAHITLKDDGPKAKNPKTKKEKEKEKSQSYRTLLESWVNSEHSHWAVQSVWAYIKKGSLIRDLIDRKVLFLDKEGKLAKSWSTKDRKEEPPTIFKILKSYSKRKQEGIAIRWRVKRNGQGYDLWMEKSLYQAWESYLKSTLIARGLCSITGKPSVLLSENGLGDIRSSGDRAKLISSNDKYNFTFRGKFNKPSEAATIGFEVNWKQHAMLKWLLRHQGYRGEASFALVAWVSSEKSPEIQQPFEDPENILPQDDEEESSNPHTGESISNAIASQIRGYAKTFNPLTDVNVIAIDASSLGRSSVVHYSKQPPSEYLENLANWHQQAAWIHRLKGGGFYTGAPTPQKIADACYGHKSTKGWATDKKVTTRTIRRILPCLLFGRAIPIDLVTTAVRRASQKGSFSAKDKNKWEEILSVACSLYRYSNRNYTMSLDNKNKSRDYLYGRLLAIADHFEARVLYRQSMSTSEKEKGNPTDIRSTNATRLMSLFSQRPYSTWLKIEKSLNPYRIRESKFAEFNFLEPVGEIMNAFNHHDFKNDRPLSGEYLLGYYSQRKEMRTPKDKNNQEKES